MSDIFSTQPLVDNTYDAEVPTAQDTQQFFANRKQRGQEQWQQEQDYKQKANIGITIAQSFLTTMVNAGLVNMGHLDCPTIKTILNDGDFTSNKIDQYSLEDLSRLVGENGEIVRFANAAINRLNRERVLRQKGGVRVKPSSEKTGRSHNPDVQAEQYDDDTSIEAEATLQQDNQAQPNANPKPDSKQPEQAGKSQPNDKQADGGPKDFPRSSSFYEVENSHANNGQTLAKQCIQETFGAAETAVKDAIGIVKTLQFDAGAFPCDGSVKTEPSDQAQASEECLLYPIGKVKLTRLQLIEMMHLGNIYTIRLNDQALKELKETATEEQCPHCGQPFYRRNIKVAEIKASWTEGHSSTLNLIPVYRYELRCENHNCPYHSLVSPASARFEPICGAYDLDCRRSTSSDKLPELLAKLDMILLSRTAKDIPSLLSKSLSTFLIEHGTELDFVKCPRIDVIRDVIHPCYLLSMGHLAGYNALFNQTSYSAQSFAHFGLTRALFATSQHATHAYFDHCFFLGSTKAERSCDYNQLNSMVTAAVRAYLWRIIEQIRHILMNQPNDSDGGTTFYIDETPVKTRTSHGAVSDIGQIWAISNGETATFKLYAAMFYPHRNADTFIDILESNKDCLDEIKMLSDLCAIYESGLKRLEVLRKNSWQEPTFALF